MRVHYSNNSLGLARLPDPEGRGVCAAVMPNFKIYVTPRCQAAADFGFEWPGPT